MPRNDRKKNVGSLKWHTHAEGIKNVSKTRFASDERANKFCLAYFCLHTVASGNIPSVPPYKQGESVILIRLTLSSIHLIINENWNNLIFIKS